MQSESYLKQIKHQYLMFLIRQLEEGYTIAALKKGHARAGSLIDAAVKVIEERKANEASAGKAY